MHYNVIIKVAQVKAGQFANLFQTVDQRVAVDKQLAGGFRHVQVVLEELLNGEKGVR